MYSIQKRYNVVLRIGHDIHSLNDDQQSIFSSFSLPSWLSHAYDVRILFFGKDQDDIPYYDIEAKAHSLDIGHDVKLIFKEVYKDYELRIIKYEVIDKSAAKGPKTETSAKNKIRVSFQKSKQNKCLYIRIIDELGILDAVFDDPELEKYVKKSHLKNSELEYPYIEPLNLRIIEETEKQHLHLAFQGGGVKGFAYIGAYKALLDIYQNILVKSVIGSSAGSMIALAITAGASPSELVDIFKQMDNIPKDKTIKTFRDITPEKAHDYNDIKIKIRRALHDYGLIQNHILDLLVEEVLKNDVIDKMMQVLCGSNQSLKQMFTMEIEETFQEGGGCCFKRPRVRKVVSNKLLNYYGILQGKLMRGKEIQNISARILGRFLQKKFKKDPELVKRIMKIHNQRQLEDKKDKLSLNMTMDQFYQLTERIEFTATGVDLQSKILRFFNHKTTPNLPVTKAVQMSGSFPIAFEALAWKKQWGKYYIHYDNIRRQINLQGHIFTDGGMLANFPIMYLDNQEMRPMYFSHKRNNKTKIFGFGLEQIPRQQNQQEVKKHQQAMQQLTQLIKKRLPVMKFVWTQLLHTPNPETVPMSQLLSLTQIPIFNFLMKVMATYLDANQNFVKQCFISKIYILNEPYSFAKFVMQRPDEKKVLVNLSNLKDSLIQLYSKLFKQEITVDSLKNAVGSSIKILDQNNELEDLLRTKNLITTNLTQYSLFLSSTLKKEQDKESQYFIALRRQQIQCNNILTQLKSVCTYEVIVKAQSHESDNASLKWLARRVIQLFYKKQNRSKQLEAKLQETRNLFFYLIKSQLLNNIQLIVGQLQTKDEAIRTKRENSENDRNQTKYNILHQLNKLYTTFPQQALPQFELFKKRFDNLNDPFMIQQIDFLNQQNNIKNYIRKMIFKRESNNIHIVFQGKGASTKFYMDIYKIINQELFMLQNTKWKALCQKIARKILKSTQKIQPDITIQIVDLMKFIILKGDLTLFIEKHMFNLPDEIDLGYQKFSILPEVRQSIEQKLQQFRDNKCKITSITCSNIHAFLGFMIAGGFNEELIQSQLVKLRDDFETDISSIQQQFKNNDWMVPFKSKIRDFQNTVWNNKFDLFQALQKSIDRKQFSLKELERIKEEFQWSKQKISDTFITILDYIVDIQMHSTSNDHLEKDIASKMSLNTKSKNFIEVNKKVSQDTRTLINYVFQQFHDQLRLVVMSVSSDHILEFLSLQSDVTKREAMWKGIIISKFMKSDRYKHHVHNLLRKMNLPKDINLKQFYEISSRKIDLNFPAVDITYCKQVFINSHTHPQMPIWAALVTALSFPVLFPELRARPGWIQKISKSRNQRNLSLFFSYQEDFKASPVLTSGNMLNSFPLQLLTNQKMRQRCFEGVNYTFLSFGVKDNKMQNKTLVDFNRKFLGFKQTIFLGSRQIANGLPKMAQAGSVLITKGNYLSGFIESHDNLMVEMYYKQLLRLPIRVGTLDFHILKNKTPLGIPLTQSILEETYYYTKQKFDQGQTTYLRIEYDSVTLKLFFLSKQRKCKDLLSKYKIEYKIISNKPYELLLTDQITISNKDHSIFIKIHYVNQNKKIIKSSQYRIELGNIVRGFSKFSGVYALAYSTIMNKSLPPVANILKQYKSQKRAEQMQNIFCKSIVNITQNGLYCVLCCDPLVKTSQISYIQQQCTNCYKKTAIKFQCQRQGCSGKYCMRCAKNHVIQRTKNQLLCDQKHEFEFVQKYQNYVIQQQNVRFARCDICLKTTQGYYQDKECDYRICQPCCADFILV